MEIQGPAVQDQIAAILTQAACTVLLARTKEGSKAKISLSSCESEVMATYQKFLREVITIEINLKGVHKP
jgi:hypothetical protein